MPRRRELVESLPGLMLLCLLVMPSLCSGCSPPHDKWTHVYVEGEGAKTPDAFHVTLASESETVVAFTCPAGDATTVDGVRCTSTGFDILASEEPFDVTLRSTGHTFSSTRVSAAAGSGTTIALGRLPEAEHTPDYVTRFDGEGCLEELEQLAISIPTDAGLSHSVKFFIRNLDSSPEIYFQDTKKYPLHFEFARRALGFEGTADQFSAEVYSPERAAMVGTLVFYPSLSGSARAATPSVEAPWTLNFFPSDPITPEQVRLAHRLVEERLTCLRWSGPAQRLVYLPATSTKVQEVSSDEAAFARAGIGWLSREDLFGAVAIQALNPGLAFGTLKRMTPEELATSVVSFRDILLLTRIPNELPVVGGTITEELQTPLAHVNVAARTRGTPNLAYPEAFQDPDIAALLGKLVRFEVESGTYSLREATQEEAEAFWNERNPERYVPSFDSSLTGIPSFDEIGFADSVRVGVKAANLAELSHILGENAPREGLAIPFHYYEAFMDSSRSSGPLCDEAATDCLTAGRDASACDAARALCLPDDEPESFTEFIARLLDEPSFKADTLVRDAVLANLRYFIEHTPVDPDFGSLLDDRVSEVFGSAKVKIRSSTNSEDLPNFSGAGLYDSHAAGGDDKPAPSEVVTRVFASVWNFRAFEERSYWNIDHRAVKMGCAINESFTDELANGVLITENVADPAIYGMYVNVQWGEVSVVNPMGGTLPEIFTILGDTGYEVARQRFSSLSPTTPILSDEQVASLYQAADKARQHFAPLYGLSAGQLILDIEFKLTPEGTIVLKQARPYTPATN